MIQKLDPDSYSSPQKPKDLSILAKFKILKEVQSENPPETLNVTAKKSTFGKTRQNLSIDLGKIDVDLKNSSDQEALIKILQKETRKQREIQFIERAVRSLKFFQDKKQDLTEKIYMHLLEKLKYEFIEKEKPLFFHGDKGDKYYIVLKGELALLLPSKPFEEKKAIDPLVLQRLKEKYYRVRDGESLMRSSTNELRPSTPQTPRLIQIVNDKFKGPMARLRCMSSVAKRKSITESGPSSPQTNSPNAGNSVINLLKPSSKQNSGFSTPTKSRLLLLNSQDFETEREREQTSFDLYISAFFPQLNLATFFTEGSAFGEIALLRKTERSGTVVSKEDSHLMILDKESFDQVLGSWERQKTDQQIQFLKSYPFFSEVNEKYLMGMLHSLEMKIFVRGEIICEENNFPEFLYLVKEGEVELSTECTVQTEQSDVQGIAVTELGRRSQKQIATVRLSLLTTGSSICEDSILLEQQTIGFQAKVCSTQAEIWLIDHSSFLQILKQQRTFNRFQDHCQQNQDIRQRRIVKISATINSEASTHLKVTRYESKRNNAVLNLRPMTDYSKDSRFLDQMIQQNQNQKEQQIQQEKQLLSKKKLKQITSKGNNYYQPVKQSKSNNEGKSQEQLLYFNNSKDCGETSGKGSARDINVQEQQQQQQQQYPSQFSISNRRCSGVFSEERGYKSDRQERTISQEKGLNSDRKYNKLDKEKISDNVASKQETKAVDIEGDFPQATSVIQSKNASSSGQQQLLSLFSRTSDIERIHKTSLQKTNIFNQITKHSLVTQQQQQQLEEEIQHQKHINNSNSSASDKPQPFLPFQKNLLFQPRLGNGLLREPFIDPFNPVSNNEGKSTCLSAREKPIESAQLFRSVSFQKIAPISQANLHEQHSHLGSPRSNFSTSINSVFSQLLKNQSVSAKNLTNFIDQTAANEQQHKQQLQHKQHNQSKNKQFECSQGSTEQRRPSVPKILIKPQKSTPYLEDGVLSPQEQQQQKQMKKKVSIVDHFIDQSPIQRLFGASIPFRSSESLPTLIQLKSHQEIENKGNNNLNKVELQPISERQSQLLRKKPAFENAYHLYSSMKSPQNIKNSSSTTHLDGFQKQHEDGSLSSRRIISTVNLNASENAFDHMRVLSTEEDLSDEEEDREQAEKKFVASTMENTYNPLQKHRQSSSNLNRQEGTKNIHMEKLRLLNSKSLASLNSFTKAKQQFMNKSNCKDINSNGNSANSIGSAARNQTDSETKNFNERTSKMSPKKQNITFTESIFYDVNKPCVNSFFRPNPTLSRALLNSSRSNSKNANNNCNNSNQQVTNNNNNSNTPRQSNQNSNSIETLRIHVGQSTASQDQICSKGKSSSNSSRIKNSSQLTFQNSYFSKPSLIQRTTNKPTPNNTTNNSNNGSKLFGL